MFLVSIFNTLLLDIEYLVNNELSPEDLHLRIKFEIPTWYCHVTYNNDMISYL